MGSPEFHEKIQFRAGAEKTAAEVLDGIHVGGINTSELAREGLKRMLRRVATDEDRVQVYERYADGEIEEEVARLLLGEEFDDVRRERAEFRDAMTLDSEDLLRE